MTTASPSYRVLMEPNERGGWTLTVPDVPGCHAVARTVAEAAKQVRAALAAFVADAGEAQLQFERPRQPA